MIGPTTRVFGVITSTPLAEGHVARLYNYLFGFNGLDAAYVPFFVQPGVLRVALDGFAQTGRAEVLHVVPAHQAEAARWASGRAEKTSAPHASHPQSPTPHQTATAGATSHARSPAHETASSEAAPPSSHHQSPAPHHPHASHHQLPTPHQAATAGAAAIDGAVAVHEGLRALRVDTLAFAPPAASLGDADLAQWLSPARVMARALDDVRRWFGRDATPPPDWHAVVNESGFRPCKLTHDDFEALHG